MIFNSWNWRRAPAEIAEPSWGSQRPSMIMPDSATKKLEYGMTLKHGERLFLRLREVPFLYFILFVKAAHITIQEGTGRYLKDDQYQEI